MKKSTILLGLGLLLSGCSSPVRYLNTEMHSAVSSGTAYTVPADSLQAQNNVRHVLLYSLRPEPGVRSGDELDRRYATARMYISLSEGRVARTAQVSGEINYYATERYENGRLVGDSVLRIPVPLQTVQLTPEHPVSLRLPRDIVLRMELSDKENILNPALRPGGMP